MGNAHLTNFFVNNESTKELELALKAYAFTEKYMKEPNPDLYFNRGTVFEYLERYSEAASALAASLEQTVWARLSSSDVAQGKAQARRD